MAGFKKKLPMSSAMRPGGFGTAPAPKANTPGSTGKGKFDISELKGPSSGPKTPSFPKPPTEIGKGIKTSMPKMPKFK